MQKPTIILTPEKAAISATGNHINLLVRVQAPDLSADTPHKHTPKRLSMVVDRSGSMGGKPLAEALKCVSHIAKHLTSKDQMSLVVYDDNVDVMVPLTNLTSVNVIEDALKEVFEGGSTDLFAGWLEGAKQLEDGNEQSISRVLLLSDGQANRGETRQHKIEEHCKRWNSLGISTTTVGLGRHFNEDLMIAMANAGGGQQYYGQTAEDLFDSFDEELSLLQSMYLRKISLKLIPAPGVIIEVLSQTVKNDDGTYKMNDLAWGSESWIGVRLHLSPTAPGEVRDLLAVSIKGTFLEGVPLDMSGPMLQLPVVGDSAYFAMNSDELVVRRLLEVEFGKDSQELRHLAKQGNRTATYQKLAEMDQKFGEHAWLKAKLLQLHRLAEEDMEMMMKEASYSNIRMSRRLASKSEVLYSIDETNSEMPAFLRKKESEGRGRRHHD